MTVSQLLTELRACPGAVSRFHGLTARQAYLRAVPEIDWLTFRVCVQILARHEPDIVRMTREERETLTLFWVHWRGVE